MPERKRFFLCEVFPYQKRVFPALADGNPPEAGSHTEAGRHRDDRPAACKCNYHHHSHHDYHINNTTIAIILTISRVELAVVGGKHPGTPAEEAAGDIQISRLDMDYRVLFIAESIVKSR